MPLYMDIHKGVEGLTADAVAHAHEEDLKIQKKTRCQLYEILVQRKRRYGFLFM